MSVDHAAAEGGGHPEYRTATDSAVAGVATGEVVAEDIDVAERLVIAPVAGMFFPAFTEVSADQPGMVAIGDEIGVVVQTGEKHPVTSSFTGRVMGMLAMPGERVRPYQPVAWLSILDD